MSVSATSATAFDPAICAHAHLEAWVSGVRATTRHPHFTPPDLEAVYAVHDAMAADPLAARLGGVNLRSSTLTSPSGI